jgi:hypothetical protein
MSIDASFAFPLNDVGERDLQDLGGLLWKWQLCGQCDRKKSCSHTHCPWNRAKKFERFWGWYKEIAGMYVPEFTCTTPALRSHSDLVDIMRLIKTNPDSQRSQLTHLYFSKRSDMGHVLPDPADQSRAFTMAARILLMVNCELSHQSIEFLEYAQFPRPWRNDRSISQFISEAFRTSSHPYFDDQSEVSDSLAIRKAVTAKSLKKKAKLCLIPTNDLRNHLRLDRKKGTVEVFHQTAVLKENLISSYSLESESTISDQVSRYVYRRRE